MGYASPSTLSRWDSSRTVSPDDEVTEEDRESAGVEVVLSVSLSFRARASACETAAR